MEGQEIREVRLGSVEPRGDEERSSGADRLMKPWPLLSQITYKDMMRESN